MNFLNKIYFTHIYLFNHLFVFLPVRAKLMISSFFSLLFMTLEVISLLLLTSLFSFVFFLNTSLGGKWLTSVSQDILSSLSPEDMGGLWFEVGELSLENGISIRDFKLNDTAGTWLEIGAFYLDFSPSQILSLFSEAKISEISANNVNFYRNPEMLPSEEKVDNEPFIIPRSVLPLPLGEIFVEKIEITNAFVGAEVMYLQDFYLDLHADIHATAHLERKKATFEIEILEKNTQVSGTVIYTPGQFYADLKAYDEIWGKTFPLLDRAELEVEAFVNAVQFPLTKDFPLTVEFEANTKFYEILWLAGLPKDKAFSPFIKTFFGFDGEKVYLEDTILEDELIDISIPYFDLNIDTMTYANILAEFQAKDLSIFLPLFHGKADGKLKFSGELLDMNAETEIELSDFLFTTSSDLSETNEKTGEHVFASKLKINGNTNINIEEGVNLNGELNLSSDSVNFFDLSHQTFLNFASKWHLDTSKLTFKDTEIHGQDIFISTPMFSLAFEPMINQDYLGMLGGSLDLSMLSLKFLGEDFPVEANASANLDFSSIKNDTIAINANIADFSYDIYSIDYINLQAQLSDLQRLANLQLPEIQGQLTSSSLETAEQLVHFLPETLFENANINFTIQNDVLAIDANTEGEIALASKINYQPLISEVDVNELSLFLASTKHELNLLEASKIRFPKEDGFTLENTKIEIEDTSNNKIKKATVNLFTHVGTAEKGNNLDILLDLNIPIALIESYQEVPFPASELVFKTDISGKSTQPEGTIEILLTDIIATEKDSVELHLIGKIQDSIMNFSGILGTKDIRELEALGNIPLNFNAFPYVDFEKPYSAKLDWKGNLSTLWQFVPSADRTLAGNAKLELNANGTLLEPHITGSFYTSKARFKDEILGISVTDVDTAAQISLDETTINIYAKDGSTSTKNDEHAAIINARIYKSNETYMLDITSALNMFSPIKSDELSIDLNGKISAYGTLLSPIIHGSIDVVDGSFTLAQFGGSSVKTLENVTFLKTNESQIDTEEESSASFNPNLRLTINIPQTFRVSGLGLESLWGGTLNLFGKLSNPLMIGTLEPYSGSFDFLGKSFELSRSLISFTGNLSLPIYDINVERKDENNNSIVRISGAGSNIKLALTSTPPLPTDEVLARMLFGKPLAELSPFEAVQVATTAAQLLSPSLNKLDVFDATRKALGLSVLRLNSNDSGLSDSEEGNILDETSIEAGTYVTDKIYLGLERSIEDTAVRVEVELLPKVKVEGRVGTDSSQAGITWTNDY